MGDGEGGVRLGLGLEVAGFGVDGLDGDGVVVVADDDLWGSEAEGWGFPGAAPDGFFGSVGVPAGWLGGVETVFEDKGLGAGRFEMHAVDEHPVEFAGDEGLGVVGGGADIAVGVVTTDRRSEDALVREKFILDELAEGFVGGDSGGVLAVVILGIELHGHDDLAAVVTGLQLVPLGADDVAGRYCEQDEASDQ